MIPHEHRIPITVLICDSDQRSRTRTRLALERARVSNSLRFVANGAELLDYLYQRAAFAGETGKAPRPGLILVDVDLLNADARVAISAIKADADLREIPVIVLSTSPLDGNALRAYGLSEKSVVAKPLTFAGLVDAMQVLGRYWFEIVELPPVPAPPRDIAWAG